MKHGLKYTVDRRQFLRLSALAASGSIMLACAQPEGPAAGGDDMGMAEDGVVDVYVWPSIALVRPEGSDPEKYKEVQDYITEQLGIRPNGFVPPPGAAGRERLNLMLSSQTEQLDMFTGDWTQYKAAIMPITDLLEEHGQNILTAFPDATWSGMKDANGDIWGIPRLGLMGHTWNFTWFREDWINDLGLPFDSEQMTIDQLESNMAAFREANPDAVLVTNNLGSLEGCLLGAWSQYGRSRWYDESDGQIKPHQLQPGYEAFLGKMNEWWNNGWFHKEVFANMDFEEVLRSGNMGIHCGWYSRMTILGQRIFLEDVIPGMDFIFPLKMVGPMGLAGTNNANMTQAYMIPANSPVAKEVIQFVNWQYDPVRDNAVTAHYGIQGKDWDWVDETKEQVHRYDADLRRRALPGRGPGDRNLVGTRGSAVGPPLRPHQEVRVRLQQRQDAGRLRCALRRRCDCRAGAEHGGHQPPELRRGDQVHHWRAPVERVRRFRRQPLQGRPAGLDRRLHVSVRGGQGSLDEVPYRHTAIRVLGLRAGGSGRPVGDGRLRP